MENLSFGIGFLLFGLIIFFPENGYADKNWGKGYHLEVSKMNTSWQSTGCSQLKWRYKNPDFFSDCERKGNIYFCKKGKVVNGSAKKLFWFSSEEDCENAISLLKEHERMAKEK